MLYILLKTSLSGSTLTTGSLDCAQSKVLWGLVFLPKEKSCEVELNYANSCLQLFYLSQCHKKTHCY